MPGAKPTATITLLARFLADAGMQTEMAAIRREHVEAFITGQLARLARAGPNHRAVQGATEQSAEDAQVEEPCQQRHGADHRHRDARQPADPTRPVAISATPMTARPNLPGTLLISCANQPQANQC